MVHLDINTQKKNRPECVDRMLRYLDNEILTLTIERTWPPVQWCIVYRARPSGMVSSRTKIRKPAKITALIILDRVDWIFRKWRRCKQKKSRWRFHLVCFILLCLFRTECCLAASNLFQLQERSNNNSIKPKASHRSKNVTKISYYNTKGFQSVANI